MKSGRTVAALMLVILEVACTKLHFEQRDKVSFLRGPHNYDFYSRHNGQFETSAAIHFAHAKAHDVLQLTPLDRAYYHDTAFNAESVAYTYQPPRIEPHMYLYGPYTGRFMWQLYRAIDWTHVHHTETYDILSSREIPWDRKKAWTDKQVHYYLKMNDRARSPAPLDVTMRRANVMMKPYFGIGRDRPSASDKGMKAQQLNTASRGEC